MDVEQNQDTEPEIGTSQTMQNKYLRKPGTFKNEDKEELSDAKFNDFEYQTTKQFGFLEIKEEIIECAMPKIEQRTDLPTKIDQDTVSENVQPVPTTIKQELENISNVKATDIKQEVSEHIRPKTECEVRELLTSECDLPILKNETSDYYHYNYLGHIHGKKKMRKRRYGCPVCQKNFLSTKSRSTHIDGHFEKRYAVCQFCGRIMKRNEFLKHILIHLVKNRIKNPIADKSLKCNIFSKQLNQRNLDEKLFKYGAYENTFKLKYNLQYLSIHNGGEKPFKCEICSKGFTIKQHLKRHLIIHSEKPFKCDICFKGFTIKQHLQQHLRIHTGEKSFKCEICSKCYDRKSTLQQHLIIHSGEFPFKCDICFKGFTCKRNLQRHLIIHTGEKPFKCDICSKGFTNKQHLQRHLIIHTGEKPFKCNICLKSFTLKQTLKQHLIIHTSGNPFKCNVCFKGFAKKSHFQQHLIIHTGEKPFKCDICSKGFTLKSVLQRHLIGIHNCGEKPFKCEICSKGFTIKQHLQQHLIIHTGEKPFKCDVCSKCFNDSSILRRHLGLHSGKKPFKCDICSKEFGHKFNLQRHLRIHTKH